jgi:hypothetical protein
MQPTRDSELERELTPPAELVAAERDPIDPELAVELTRRGLATLQAAEWTDARVERRVGERDRRTPCPCRAHAGGRRTSDHRSDLTVQAHEAMHDAGLCDCTEAELRAAWGDR